jgi:hypothetical protein
VVWQLVWTKYGDFVIRIFSLKIWPHCHIFQWTKILCTLWYQIFFATSMWRFAKKEKHWYKLGSPQPCYCLLWCYIVQGNLIWTWDLNVPKQVYWTWNQIWFGKRNIFKDFFKALDQTWNCV